MHIPEHLLDMWNLYKLYVETKFSSRQAKSVVAETQSAILRDLLPQLGYTHKLQGKKMTKAEVESAYKFMSTVRLEKFIKIRDSLDSGDQPIRASQSSQKTYRARRKHFLEWCEQEQWWTAGLFSGVGRKRNQYCPKIKQGHGTATDKHLTNRRGTLLFYKLQAKEVTLPLEQSLENFYKFLTEPYRLDRLIRRIEESSASIYLNHILLFLGWFHHYQDIPCEKLNLELLVPKISKDKLNQLNEDEQQELWKQQQIYVETWLCNYFEFLREDAGSRSPRTKKFKMQALISLSKFLYRAEVQSIKDYSKIPVFKTFLGYSTKVRKECSSWCHRETQSPCGLGGIGALADGVQRPGSKQ